MERLELHCSVERLQKSLRKDESRLSYPLGCIHQRKLGLIHANVKSIKICQQSKMLPSRLYQPPLFPNTFSDCSKGTASLRLFPWAKVSATPCAALDLSPELPPSLWCSFLPRPSSQRKCSSASITLPFPPKTKIDSVKFQYIESWNEQIAFEELKVEQERRVVYLQRELEVTEEANLEEDLVTL